MVEFLQALIRQQITALNHDVRFVFIQPSYISQHALLTMFLNEPSCIYARLDEDNVNFQDLQKMLQDILVEHQLFDWATVRLLIIDDCDRIQDDVLSALLVYLLPYENLRVLLLGRIIPDFVLHKTQLQSRLRVIPDDPSLMFLNYTGNNDRNTLLEVRAFGQGQVLVNGKPVAEWDGDLPHDLFFYLVDRGMTTRAQIFEAFWPDLPAPEATNVFHVTKRKINEVLGVDLTEYTGGFYRIASSIELAYDVSLFTEMLQRSAVEPQGASQNLLMRAIWLYKGEFLTSIRSSSMKWVQHRRAELGQQYGEALMAMGKIAALEGEARRSLGYYLRAGVYNRQREDLAGLVMSLYRDLGLHQDAIVTYMRIEKEISDTLGISPAQWLQDLAENIRTQAKTVSSSISK